MPGKSFLVSRVAAFVVLSLVAVALAPAVLVFGLFARSHRRGIGC